MCVEAPKMDHLENEYRVGKATLGHRDVVQPRASAGLLVHPKSCSSLFFSALCLQQLWMEVPITIAVCIL